MRDSQVSSLATDFVASRYLKTRNLVGSEGVGTYGIAILTKFPILDTKTFYYKKWCGRPRRGVLACKVKANTTLVWVLVTHLQHDLSGHEQSSQLEELFRFLNGFISRQDPVIVLGDFNMPGVGLPGCNDIVRSNEFYDAGSAIYDAGSAIYGAGSAPLSEGNATFPANCARLRLDRILLRRCGLVKFETLRQVFFAVASDHLPIAARVRVPVRAANEVASRSSQDNTRSIALPHTR